MWRTVEFELLPTYKPHARLPGHLKAGPDTILVLDYGSQYTALIARRIREAEVFSEILPASASLAKILAHNPVGVILSGSDASVYEDGAPTLPDGLLASGIPILAICYGQQLVAHDLGGVVTRAEQREYGPAQLEITDTEHPLFAGFPEITRVWMSHADRVMLPPPGFEQLARTENSEWAALGSDNLTLLQFHPEVSHTQLGHALLRNFALGVCHARPSWTPANFVSQTVDQIAAAVGDAGVIVGISGGVDSAVAAALLQRAVGDQLTGIFVDTGMLRRGEVDTVCTALVEQLGIDLVTVDAGDRFLDLLAGVSDPERKRILIGDEFFEVFVEQGHALTDIEYFVQGTIYPDVIESAAAGLRSAKIKTHHNTRIPDQLHLKVIEPLRRLFKDEVRAVGLELGLPEGIVWRQPFPGPGLAVRIIGPVDRQRVAALQLADHIWREEIAAEGLDRAIAQYFAVLTGVRTVGVMGDSRSYGELAALRAVNSDDFMTADWSRLPNELLAQVSSRIVNEVPLITRVVYDITSKPPGTIEWE